jgi:threonyl-tRNA synthetase
MNVKYHEAVGEAAFYGPKIDIQIKTALGHIITAFTIQLDFLLPDKFKLEYKDKGGAIKRPVLIHASVIGTIERFMSILLEQNKGVFPL